MTAQQQHTIDSLIDAARQVMHHDADEDSDAWKYEVEVLTKDFYRILYGAHGR